MQRTPNEKATLVALGASPEKSRRLLFHRRRMIFSAERAEAELFTVRALAKYRFAA